MAQINKVNVSNTTYDISQSPDATFTATSNDNTSPTSWTDVAVLASGETNSSIFNKISSMFKNIRFLYSKLGTSDFSSAGNTVSAALAALQTNKASTATFTSAANGLVPAAKSGTTNWATSAYVLTGAGWKAGTKYNVDNNTTYATVTTTADGLMTSSDKTKLDGIADNANNYTHPTYTSAASALRKFTVDGTGHVSGTAAVAKSDITGLGIPAQDTTYAAFTSADNGLVPAAKSGDTSYLTSAYVLTGAGWKAGTKYNTDTNTTYAVATTNANGLMPALNGNSAMCLLGDGTWGTAGSTYANVSTTAPGLAPTLSGTATEYLNGNGEWTTPPDNNTTYAVATSTAPGLCPQLVGLTNVYFLKGDGTWAVPTNTTYANFTSAAAGLVPAAKSGSTNIATTGYVLTGAGWKAGTKYNTDNNTTYAFSNKGVTLSWNTQSTIATVGGVDITVKMPANPNTNTTYGTNVGCYGTLTGTTLVLNTRNFRV